MAMYAKDDIRSQLASQQATATATDEVHQATHVKNAQAW